MTSFNSSQSLYSVTASTADISRNYLTYCLLQTNPRNLGAIRLIWHILLYQLDCAYRPQHLKYNTYRLRYALPSHVYLVHIEINFQINPTPIQLSKQTTTHLFPHPSHPMKQTFWLTGIVFGKFSSMNLLPMRMLRLGCITGIGLKNVSFMTWKFPGNLRLGLMDIRCHCHWAFSFFGIFNGIPTW